MVPYSYSRLAGEKPCFVGTLLPALFMFAPRGRPCWQATVLNPQTAQAGRPGAEGGHLEAWSWMISNPIDRILDLLDYHRVRNVLLSQVMNCNGLAVGSSRAIDIGLNLAVLFH